MAHVRNSKWYRAPSLIYKAPIQEVRRQEQDYRDWLAEQRQWTPAQVSAYLKAQEAWLKTISN